MESRAVEIVRSWLAQSIVSVATSGVALLCSGCVIPVRYQASVPQSIPTGFDGRIDNQTITLALPELSVSAQIQAYDWDGQYLLPPLGVWLEFDPGSEWITLDPLGVTLQSDDGDEMQAVSFLGPSRSWFSARALASGCGPRRYHSGMAITNIAVSQQSVIDADTDLGIFRPASGPVISNGRACFLFWFDTDSLPDHVFTLSIEGIEIRGSEVRIPAMRFEQGSLTTVGSFP
jgi:hypothetical protein